MRTHLLVVALATSGCAHSHSAELQQPETATGFRTVARSQALKFMAATANRDATAAAVEILRAGGNALDAAVAVQMVLAVTEPQSSGIGGGTFLTYYNRGTDIATRRYRWPWPFRQCGNRRSNVTLGVSVGAVTYPPRYRVGRWRGGSIST